MLRKPGFRIVRAGLGVSLIGGTLAAVVSVLGTSVPASAQPNPPGTALIVNNGSYSNQSALPSACATAGYSTIQSAVNAASSGAIVYVCAGTYNETVTISQPLVLDGAEFGVNAVGRTGQPETLVDSTGGIGYATGATTGTISGIDLSGYTGSGPGEIQADPGLSGVGSGWTFTDNKIDASNGGIGLNTDNVSNPAPTMVADNAFTQSTPAASESGGGWYGQAVTIWGDPGDNVTVAHNDFANLSGPGAAINTTGASSCDPAGTDSSQDLSVSNNTYEEDGAGGVDENFVALFCTTDATISGNTLAITDAGDANAESPLYLGGGNIAPVISGNTETGNGAPDAAGVEVNAAFYPTDNATVENNHIAGFNWGVLLYGGYGGPGADPFAAPSGFTVEGNTIASSVSDGIDILDDGASPSNFPSGGTISGNNVQGSASDDCIDQSSGGSGTDGTDNTWSDNIGVSSSPDSPTALCGPASSTTATSPTDATVQLGQADTDFATVTGTAVGGSPTGTVTFYVCGPTSTPTPCTSRANQVGGPVNLSSGAGNTATATSSSFTPNAVGDWSFAAVYAGSGSYTGSTEDSLLEVVNVKGPLTVITSSLPSGTKGTSYSTTLVARGGTQPYRWTHGHLPRGLSLSRTTGVLAGTPRGHGTYTVTVHVRDASHPRQLVTAHFTLVIAL